MWCMRICCIDGIHSHSLGCSHNIPWVERISLDMPRHLGERTDVTAPRHKHVLAVTTWNLVRAPEGTTHWRLDEAAQWWAAADHWKAASAKPLHQFVAWVTQAWVRCRDNILEHEARTEVCVATETDVVAASTATRAEHLKRLRRKWCSPIISAIANHCLLLPLLHHHWNGHCLMWCSIATLLLWWCIMLWLRGSRWHGPGGLSSGRVDPVRLQE